MVDWFDLKALADNEINLTLEVNFAMQRTENIVGKGENAFTLEVNFVLQKIENIVGKGENAGYQLCCFSCSIFKSIVYLGVKCRDCLVKNKFGWLYGI